MARRRNGVRVTPNFQLYEFESPDTRTVIVDPLLADALQAVRVDFGGPVTVSSGYRTRAHNTAVGGVPNSRHMFGDAADLVADAGAMERLFHICDRHPHLDAINEGDHIHVQITPALRLEDVPVAPPAPPVP